jgi:hypothetical protein
LVLCRLAITEEVELETEQKKIDIPENSGNKGDRK